ncbi:hypothetical protein BCF53_1042 [Reinekea marinisedimentorum]|uniref:Uncharacterized protein n=1 Tax=Reinekea marinisedimentorum TaxID=230495 RepID=A0A4V2UJY6_9GAMM|nr:hypothetical protein BCF53_1042 [Reinekea marinisedimentorum]
MEVLLIVELYFWLYEAYNEGGQKNFAPLNFRYNKINRLN